MNFKISLILFINDLIKIFLLILKEFLYILEF